MENDNFKEHRFLQQIDSGIEKGFSTFFLNGKHTNDYYFFNNYLGIRTLRNTLYLYFMNIKRVEYFIHIKDNQITFLSPNGEKVERDSVFEKPKSSGAFQNVAPKDIKNDDEINSRKISETQETADNSSFENTLKLINDAILKEDRNFVIFFEDFEWLAGLYSPEPNLSLIKYLRIWKKTKKSIVVISIKNPAHLKEFDIDTDDDLENIINVSSPSVNEIINSYFRYIARHSPKSEIINTELQEIAASIQKDKKSLRESIRILKNTLISKPKKITMKLFENRTSDNLDEKIKFDDVILEDNKKKEILDKTDSFKNKSENRLKGIILYGPSGTGKTYISKAIATEYNMNFMAPTLSDLKGEYIGHSSAKIKRIFDEARANAPTILFLDEIDTIFTSRSANRDSDSFSKDMVNQFLVEIDGAKTGKQEIFIIGATNRLKSIDSAILSRLQPQIKIPLPNKVLREKIFDSKFKEFKLSKHLWKEEILNKTAGMSGRDITEFVKIIRETVKSESEINYSCFKQSLIIYEEQFVFHFENDMDNILTIQKIDLLKYKDIIGYNAEKKLLQQEADFILSDIDKKNQMRKFNIEPERGTLLYGSPGNGKTILAEALSGENNFYYLKILSKNFTSPMPNESLKKIGDIFEKSLKLANMATSQNGVVLFFDEIDTLISANMDRTVRGTLLSLIENKDGIKNRDSRVLLIAATNNQLSELDEASIRAGRFDKKLLISNPEKETGIKILKSFFEKDEMIKLTKDKEYFKNLYKKIEDEKGKNNISIADLKNKYQRIKSDTFYKGNINDGKIIIEGN